MVPEDSRNTLLSPLTFSVELVWWALAAPAVREVCLWLLLLVLLLLSELEESCISANWGVGGGGWITTLGGCACAYLVAGTKSWLHSAAATAVLLLLEGTAPAEMAAARAAAFE